SISRSSLPVRSPFTCKLGPNHAVGRSATESTGRVVSELFLSIWEFLGSRGTACGSFGFFAFQTNPFLASPLLFLRRTHTTYGFTRLPTPNDRPDRSS